jgi:hypothetical protein
MKQAHAVGFRDGFSITEVSRAFRSKGFWLQLKPSRRHPAAKLSDKQRQLVVMRDFPRCRPD